eukprot:Hpha_TRINITY_DN7534_c0_g1::TRINITY_DN7534_c0_g1_i1::g.19039::m.19039/K13761/PDE9; high affinity cGMP-specific 3',5'-cyclic phosphodiesterase 9
MEMDKEFQYMQDSGLPELVESLLARLLDARSDDPMLVVSEEALGVRVHALAEKLKEQWPTGEHPVIDGERRALATFDFNVFDFADSNPHADRLLLFLEVIFTASGAIEALGCSPEKLRLWLLAVRAQYSGSVPFHNFRHVFAVTQTAYAMLMNVDGLMARLGGLDVAALLFSTLCHDIGHPGLNNAYQRNKGTALATRYNDASVLENYHCCLAFETLRCPDLNILSALSPEKRKSFRELAIASILATDVSLHKSHYQRLSDLLKKAQEAEKGQGLDLINWNETAERTVVVQNLMMMADISNETKAFSISQRWAPLVIEEFCRQGDLEKKEGLPWIPMCDREKVVAAKEQQGFIKFLCLPLYETALTLFPQLQSLVDSLKSNAAHWAEIEAAT